MRVDLLPDRLFRILGHPIRLAILDALRDGEQCVCHLEAKLGRRQAYISQHLAALRAAGLVEDRREGWNSYYRVCDARVFVLLAAAQALAGNGRTTGRKRPPGEPAPACPCPKCTSGAAAAEQPAA